MNLITVAGHLGADPEVRFTSSGQKVTTLRVATRARRAKDKDETIWWRITIWGEQFDKMIPYFKKGSAIIVSGELSKPEIFTDREGRAQISMNITAQSLQFNPFGKGEHAASSSGEPSSEGAQHAEMAYAGSSGQGKSDQGAAQDDEEIPF